MTSVAERIASPTRADAEKLCRVEGNWCVSIYLPVQDGWGDLSQNAIRLKNLLHEVDERLASMGADAALRRELIAGAGSDLLSGRPPRLPRVDWPCF